MGFRAVHVVSMPTAKSGGTLALTDEKTIFLIDSHSAFFDILLPQKVRQVGLSETHDTSLSFTTRFATEPVKQLFAVYVKLQKVTVFQ